MPELPRFRWITRFVPSFYNVWEKQSCNLGTNICEADDTAHQGVKGGSDRNAHQMFLSSLRAQMNPTLQQLVCHIATFFNTIDNVRAYFLGLCNTLGSAMQISKTSHSLYSIKKHIQLLCRRQLKRLIFFLTLAFFLYRIFPFIHLILGDM